MPKFNCSYACDIACLADFVVEAKSEQAARRKIGKALRAGRFENTDVTPCWQNGANNERVFVHGPVTGDALTVALEELVGDKKHQFNPHTQGCVKYGQHADDDAVENIPCTK